jgi:hypothetical protein
MDAPEALAYIAARLHPEDDPALDPDDLTDLLFMAATTDEDGYCPGDDNWTPTYSTVGCYRAIAEGWAMKRGKVVGRFNFTTDGQQFQRAQVRDHIENERQRWQAKVQSSPSTLGASQ